MPLPKSAEHRKLNLPYQMSLVDLAMDVSKLEEVW
jgi:hypothetical protein